MDIKYAPEVVLAIRQAGKMMTKDSFREIKDKGTIANLVTDMDIKVQDFLKKALLHIIPQSTFVAEEDEVHEEKDGYVWVIDPIDGTTNYIYDFKHSAISVALVYEHEAILGVVYDPYMDEMFIAGKGAGAYVNDKPIRVSKNPLAQSLIMCGTSPYDKAYAQVTFDVMRRMFMAGKDIRRSGSAVLDLCYLASGRVDGFYEQKLSPWDYAAGALMVLEAGGRIMTLDGTIQYSKRIGMIAGNANNIEDLIEITGRAPEHIIIGTCHGIKPLNMFNDVEPTVEAVESPLVEEVKESVSQEQPVVLEETSIVKETPSMELLKEEPMVSKEEILEKTDSTLDSILEDMVQEQKEDNQ